jgi:hypothetical protein
MTTEHTITETPTATPTTDGLTAEHVRAVRVGHGANCSSIGSVIDTLFASAVVGGAIFAAVLAALSTEPVKVVGEGPTKEPDPPEEGSP